MVGALAGFPGLVSPAAGAVAGGGTQKLYFGSSGQSLDEYLAKRGAPLIAMDMVQQLANVSGVTLKGPLQKFGGTSGSSIVITDGTSATDNTANVRYITDGRGGAPLIDVNDTPEINPATSSSGYPNYFYNTQDNSAITGNSADTANTPGPLWRLVIASLMLNGHRVTLWSQGNSDSSALGTPSSATLYKTILKQFITACQAAVPGLIWIFWHNGRSATGSDSGFQALCDLQTQICAEMTNVVMGTEEYFGQYCIDSFITGCTWANNANTITCTDSSQVTALTSWIETTGGLAGIQPNTKVLTIPNSTSFTIDKPTTAANATPVSLGKLSTIHLYPNIDPTDTNGNTIHDPRRGFYGNARRMIPSIQAALTGGAVPATTGPAITSIIAGANTSNIRCYVQHDQGTALYTYDVNYNPQTIGASSASSFFLQVAGSTVAITNVVYGVDGSSRPYLDLTTATPFGASGQTYVLNVVNGAMRGTDFTSFIADNAPAPSGMTGQTILPRPLQRASSTSGYANFLNATVGQGLPNVMTAPKTTGLASPGSTMTASAGTFSEGPITSTTYQWKRATSYAAAAADTGAVITGQTGATYASVSGDLGSFLYCNVTATNAVGSVTVSTNAVLVTNAYSVSTQSGTITIAAGALTGTATINQVGANAYEAFDGASTGNTNTTAVNAEEGYIQLTNATTVTAYRTTSDPTYSLTVAYTIHDPSNNLVDNVQRGVISINNSTTATATLAQTLDLTRSAVYFLGQATSSGNNVSRTFAGVSMANVTSTTVITGTLGVTANTTTCKVGYVAVECVASTINSVQQVTLSPATGNLSDSYAISSVVMANSIIAYGGASTTSNSIASSLNRLVLASSTSLSVTRESTTSGAARSVYGTVIEFVSGVMLRAVTRGTVAMSSVATNTAAGTAGTNSMTTFTGSSTNATSPAEAFASLTFDKAGGTITGTKGAAGATSATIAWENYEFGPPGAATLETFADGTQDTSADGTQSTWSA